MVEKTALGKKFTQYRNLYMLRSTRVLRFVRYNRIHDYQLMPLSLWVLYFYTIRYRLWEGHNNNFFSGLLVLVWIYHYLTSQSLPVYDTIRTFLRHFLYAIHVAYAVFFIYYSLCHMGESLGILGFLVVKSHIPISLCILVSTVLEDLELHAVLK